MKPAADGGRFELTTADYHTAGEPFRIVTTGYEVPQGDTVLDRRTWAKANLDDVRAFLVNEPRGHADMYGGFITPPDDEGADIGVLFFHKDGFSTACGHGTIALATWAIDSGRLDVSARSTDGGRTVGMHIDVPSGRLRVLVELDEDDAVDRVRFWNVDSFVTAQDLSVETSIGTFSVDVSFGGAFYGSVPLDETDVEPGKGDLDRLIDLARQIKAQFVDHPAVTHADDRLSGMYGVIFHQDHGGRSVLEQRNVTVFADGEVDRSPCGSGTSARLAVLQSQGRLAVSDRFLNHGIAEGTFDAKIESVRYEGDRVLVATSVSGSAYATGRSAFFLDQRDPIGLGFLLR